MESRSGKSARRNFRDCIYLTSKTNQVGHFAASPYRTPEVHPQMPLVLSSLRVSYERFNDIADEQRHNGHDLRSLMLASPAIIRRPRNQQMQASFFLDVRISVRHTWLHHKLTILLDHAARVCQFTLFASALSISNYTRGEN